MEPVPSAASARTPRWTELLSTQSATASGVLATWIVCASCFALRQELWVDETTQLSGLTLGPLELVRWLGGAEASRFGVPGDRSAPLAYWLGWLWAQAFGLGENALRAFGIVCVAVGLALLVRSARRAGGPLAGWVAGLALALSPNVIVTGVEVRSYPLFFALACALLGAVVELLRTREPRARHWIALATFSVLSAYTHFFGLVGAGAAFVATAPWVSLEGRQLKPWLLSGVAVALALLGLAPFVLGAVGLSGPEENAAGGSLLSALVHSSVRLVYRLAGGHPAVAVERPVAALVLVGTGALVALSLFAADAGPRRLARRLGLGLGAGLAVVFAAKLAAAGFDALGLKYNLWALPWIALLCGVGANALRERVPGLGLGLAAALVGGSAAATAVLLLHAECFAHSAADRLLAEIEAGGGPDGLAVVHDGDYVYPYFPLFYKLQGRLAQYTVQRDAAGALQIRPITLALADPPASLASLGAQRVLLISSRGQDTEDIRRFLHGAPAPSFADPALRAALAGLGLAGHGGHTLMALGASEFEWFVR